jgi:hypothetical protein
VYDNYTDLSDKGRLMTKKQEILWSANGSLLLELQPHTRAKHQLGNTLKIGLILFVPITDGIKQKSH